MTTKTLERAYELAETGQYRSIKELEAQLRAEGLPNTLTALRSRLMRRELSRLCRAPQGSVGRGREPIKPHLHLGSGAN